MTLSEASDLYGITLQIFVMIKSLCRISPPVTEYRVFPGKKQPKKESSVLKSANPAFSAFTYPAAMVSFPQEDDMYE